METMLNLQLTCKKPYVRPSPNFNTLHSKINETFIPKGEGILVA